MLQSNGSTLMTRNRDEQSGNQPNATPSSATGGPQGDVDNVTPISTHPLERKQDDWAPILKKVAQKDRAAYAKLFQHFSPKVKSFALMLRSSFTSQEMADELVQEVMLKVWLKADSFNPSKASVNTWIFTIARNARIDYLRKMKRGDVQLDNDAMWELTDDREPVTSLEELRVQKHMRSAIENLPREQAEALKQIYLEGKSHAEVAEQTSLPLGTVKSRVRLAMNKLRARLAESDEILSFQDNS